jgi:hypothetical protein
MHKNVFKKPVRLDPQEIEATIRETRNAYNSFVGK